MAKQLTKTQTAILNDLTRRYANKKHEGRIPQSEINVIDGRSLAGLFEKGALRWNDHGTRNAATLTSYKGYDE